MPLPSLRSHAADHTPASMSSAIAHRMSQGLLIIALTSAAVTSQAGVQRAVCNGSPDAGAVLSGNTVWAGNWTYLNNSGWQEATGFIRNLTDGDVGQRGGFNVNGNYSVCWSLSPFTIGNTNNGETCTHEGPLPYTTGQTYYRMNIDRSTTPAEYCQVAMVTAAAAPGIGNTFVVPLRAGPATNSEPVPLMPASLLGLTAAGLGLLGRRKLRKG